MRLVRLGKAFEVAGFGQWGLSIQDDVTAGVERLIKQGIADPKRICIYGASYGGYATVWGLIKTSEPYRCGISLAGVSGVPLPSEGHGIYYSSNRIKFLGALMAFIDKNIGPTPESKSGKP